MSRTLPPKEQSLFKSLVRLYETKQFKKAVKVADQILKKFPEHGETLAMKGLTINQLDRKTEAYELVRKGLKKDFTSHICWHVYGLLYRSDHDYHEAAKAYLNALRRDPDNQQIIRDLALLQVQIRDYDGYEESRRKLLVVRPNQRNNWVGLALSFHLQGNYDQALQVLKTYQDTLDDADGDQDPYERSELTMYKVSIMEEASNFTAALECLDRSTSRIVDRLGYRETRARILSALSRFDEAGEQLRALIAINPDNHNYIRDLCSAVTHSETDADIVLKKSLIVLDELAAKYPRANAPQRIAIELIPNAEHEQFLPRVDKYVRPILQRGVPSLFSDLKSLYASPSKSQALEGLFSSYAEGLKSTAACLPAPLVVEGYPAESSVECLGSSADSPSTLLWLYHLLAQHYDCIGDPERALHEIELALDHTPTCIESNLVKARILKHCGDLKSALEVADAARKMDLSDRFVNTKCVKYALRADAIPKAESWISLFTRDGDSGGVQALYDMQCMWFELEAAESHFRCRQIAPALKKFIAVERHFEDITEDQFDFHTYCLRKVTLRAYVKMLRMEDRLRSHPCFERAAGGIIRSMIYLEDMSDSERKVLTGGFDRVEGFAEMSDSDRKKALNKMKKREAKKRSKGQSVSSVDQQTSKHVSQDSPSAHANTIETTVVNGSANGVHDGGVAARDTKSSSGASTKNLPEKTKSNSGWMEIDTNGIEFIKKLLNSESSDFTPLGEASKRVRALERYAPNSLSTHVLAFEVAVRNRKILQAIRAVRRAQRSDSSHPVTVLISVRCRHAIDTGSFGCPTESPVSRVIQAKGNILGDKNIVQYVHTYISASENHPTRYIGAAETMFWLAQADYPGAESVAEVLEYLLRAIRGAKPYGNEADCLSPRFCAGLLSRLTSKNYGLSPSALERVAELLRSKYPRCTLFKNGSYGSTS